MSLPYKGGMYFESQQTFYEREIHYLRIWVQEPDSLGWNPSFAVSWPVTLGKMQQPVSLTIK